MSVASLDVSLLDVTDAHGHVLEPMRLADAHPVHRQLRLHLPEALPDYLAKMQRVFAGGGRMLVAVKDGTVSSVAVWRMHENTFDGLRFYVDDLVTDDGQRSQGVGKAMLDGLRARAQALNCDAFALDSGVQRQQAHKFYFRENMVVTSFSFKQALHS